MRSDLNYQYVGYRGNDFGLYLGNDEELDPASLNRDLFELLSGKIIEELTFFLMGSGAY